MSPDAAAFELLLSPKAARIRMRSTSASTGVPAGEKLRLYQGNRAQPNAVNAQADALGKGWR